jgi:hypothetical protein
MLAVWRMSIRPTLYFFYWEWELVNETQEISLKNIKLVPDIIVRLSGQAIS